ncbi:DegT/DnrJ/EryC1/StrS family aminotransferase [Thermosipho sp. 1070]|uniref:DegT/DnrJ/EryC1/StrS family aminotransferase n=1 Tax=Thermosipho sp. 1070 TaxID=1437364 RepID=UPI00094942B8|nr:DegT/DnrJ/EryC1/StrS family aminotransferase [Thermosipho sp. 1070]ANQ53647.1 pyridoxamine 5-phosphate oxidase [Thermosipho sp. 1070]
MKNFYYELTDDTWGREEIEAILEVIKSRKFTMGDKTKEFEKRFAEYFGCKYAVMVNSGSSANLLAIATLVYSGKLKEGDEVIVPAVSWSTTYYPVFQFNLKLKFVDIDFKTLNINVKELKNAITDKTKAIFVVNLLGNPNEFDEIKKICKEKGLILIEDNCESMGAKYKGKYTGTFGLIGTFSTFYSHHISTMEGGIAVTNDEELYHYMLSIRAHGWTRNLPNNSSIYTKHIDEFYEMFNFIVPGFNIRPLEIEAAVGIKQLKKLNIFIHNRRKNADYFVNKINQMENYSTQKEIGESSWFGFPIILTNDLEGKRNMIVKKLKENNIEVRPIVAGNFTRHKVIKYMNYEIYGKLKNADYIHENGFFIGNHSFLDIERLKIIINILKNI